MPRRSGGDFPSPVLSTIDTPVHQQEIIALSPTQHETNIFGVNAQAPSKILPEDSVERGRWHLRHRRPSMTSVEGEARPIPRSPERHSIPAVQNNVCVVTGKRMRKPAEVIPICGLCLGTYELNKQTGFPEDLIACWICGQSGHPTCLKMPPELVARIRQLRWRCVDCKRCCLCQVTSRTPSVINTDLTADKDLLLCDSCDRGFHMTCLEPAVSELPEGSWICPICSTEDALSAPVDPRLGAISICDRLTQHEIDWMHSMLNTNQDQDASTKLISSGASKLNIPTPSHCSPTPDPTTQLRSQKLRRSGGAPVRTRNLTSVNASKRLVQKSLASWAVSKTRRSPNKSVSRTSGSGPQKSSATMSPIAPRPRRTSAVASQAWQSLVRKRPSQEAKREDTSIIDDDDDKTDVLVEENGTGSFPRKSPARSLFAQSSPTSLRIRGRSASHLQLLDRRSRSQEIRNPVQCESMVSSIIRSQSPEKLMSDVLSIRSHRPQIVNRPIVVRPSRGRRRKNWRQAPSRSTLHPWSSAGVNVKRALGSFGRRGRGKHSVMRRYTPRLRGSSRPQSDSKRSQNRSLITGSVPAISGDEDDVDDDSSITVAAANGDSDHVGKKDRKPTAAFDPFNDECPEFAVVTEDNRALFASIQADVQACLPQPLESSKIVPPVNNPKLVINMDTASQDSTMPGEVNEAKLEEARFPPRIQLGRHLITTWYSAPYPSEYARLNLLYICEFCLKYSKTRKVYLRHIEKCPYSFPPGNEIYRCGNVSVFEVDGYTSRLYCQQLCLLAKLFLDHKTLYYDVEPFLFYVVALREAGCFQLVGYFSKEKRSAQKYNLSCIMVLPPYQKAAYGRFLIDFSFLLSRIEDQPGSPEKPLSELGRLSYESYWRSKVLPFILDSLNKYPNGDDTIDFHECVSTIHQISTATGIDPHDVGETIEQLATSIQLGADKRLLIRFDKSHLLALKAKYDARSKYWIPVDEDCLRWSPLIHPREIDTSAEVSASHGDVRLSRTRSRITRSNSNTATTQSPQGMNRFTSPTSSPEPTPGVHDPIHAEELQSMGSRRRLRSDSMAASTILSPQLPKTMGSPVVSSTVGRARLSLRTRLGTSPLLNPTSHVLSTPELSQNSHVPLATRSNAVLTTREPVLNSPTQPVESRTSQQPRKSAPSTNSPQVAGNGDITTPNDRWQNRRPRKRSGQSPCRKKPFFPNGPKPPDPPSPHGGPSTLGRPGLLSAATQSRSRRLRLSQPNNSETTNSTNQNAADHGDQSPAIQGDGQSATPNGADRFPCYNQPTPLSFRVNSSLPETSDLSPLRPTHSSSPLRLTEKLLDAPFCGPPSPRTESPPPLTPPPPTLSFLGGMDSGINDQFMTQKLSATSPKVPSSSAVPPCLSLCESTYPVPSPQCMFDSAFRSVRANSDLLADGVSSKDFNDDLWKRRRRRHTTPPVLFPNESRAIGRRRRRRSYLDSPLLSHSQPDYLASWAFRALPSITVPPAGSSGRTISEHNTVGSRLDVPMLLHTRSCPISPVDLSTRDFPSRHPQRQPRSASTSLLQETSVVSELPLATLHSPSRSPPLLPSPVLDGLSKDFPLLVPMSMVCTPRNSYQSQCRRDSGSPSPPLLTTILPAKKQLEGYSTGHPPVLYTTDIIDAMDSCGSSELPGTLLAGIAVQHGSAYPAGLKTLSKVELTDFSETSSLTTIPMYQDGDEDTMELDAPLVDASRSAESSSDSATLPHWPSPPFTRHSSEETIAMRLVTPSPPLLSDDEDCDLFSTTLTTAFTFKDDRSRLLHHCSRFRRCSEPHIPYTLFPDSPMLTQRENSCPSLLSSFSLLCDLSTARSRIPSPDRSISLSESCSHSVINFHPLSDNHPGQLEPQSQSTSNATPDSFVDEEPPCVHSESELKLAVQVSWESLVAESVFPIPPIIDEEHLPSCANRSIVPRAVVNVSLQEFCDTWENLQLSAEQTVALASTQVLSTVFRATCTQKPLVAYAVGVRYPISPREIAHFDVPAADLPAALEINTVMSTSRSFPVSQTLSSEVSSYAVHKARRFSMDQNTGCLPSKVSPLSVQKFISDASDQIANYQSPVIQRQTPLPSPPIGVTSPTLQLTSPHSPFFSLQDKSTLCGPTIVPLSSSSHLKTVGSLQDDFSRSTERCLQLQTNTPLSYTPESDQQLDERTDRSSESSEFVSPDANQLLSNSSSSFQSGCTSLPSLDNPHISFHRRISPSTDTDFITFPSLPSSTVSCVVAGSAYDPSTHYLSPNSSALSYQVATSALPSRPSHPSSVNLAYSLPRKSVNSLAQSGKRRIRRNSNKTIQPAPPHSLPLSPSNRYQAPAAFSPLTNVSVTTGDGQCSGFTYSLAPSIQSNPPNFPIQPAAVLHNSFHPVQLSQSSALLSTAVPSFQSVDSSQLCPSTPGQLPTVSTNTMTCLRQVEVYAQPDGSNLFAPQMGQTAYNSYTMPYSLQAESQSVCLEKAYHPSSTVTTAHMPPFLEASVSSVPCTYPCVLSQPAQSQMLLSSQLQPVSCPSDVFPPTNTHFELNQISMDHATEPPSSVAPNPSFFSTSFQSPTVFNSPRTDTINASLISSHAGGDFTRSAVSFIPGPSNSVCTSLSNGFNDPQTQYMLPFCELPQYPTRPNVDYVLPTTTSLINTIPCPGPVYPPGGAVDQPLQLPSTPQSSPQQQLIFCPPMLFCSPNELQGGGGFEFPTSPQRFTPFLPVMNGGPSKAPLSSLHPLVGQPPPGWPRAELFPGQVLPQTSLPPPNPMMPI
ncbi:histone acetyltransferase MYST4 [Clonorchis sinensis]|uniref:histone acetyltransferase n=1 Tax=Clonorchis sinensis TaxID=79923 RepID=G7Y8D1_CLOSI|nr:histone acetyltransferase MYST4 [Clonorchis sinensis]